MKLENVVPFGRTLEEYCALFDLQAGDLSGKILSVADGPASFNAQMYARGNRVISVDPIYLFGGDEIRDRFYRVVDDIIRQVANTPGDWVWKYHASPDALRNKRVEALESFLADYDAGRKQGRYIPARLPVLPFRDQSFDLALCSHFLFLYSDHLSLDFHLRSLRELLRVAREVRVYPLLTLGLKPSPYISPVIDVLEKEGIMVSLHAVEYELQRGATQAMILRHT